MVVQDRTRTLRELSIPIISEDIPPTYLNYKCTWLEEGSDVLLELDNASPFIQLSHDWNHLETIQLEEGDQQIVELFPGRCIHLGTFGDSYPFIVVVRCISLSPQTTNANFSISPVFGM